MANRKKPTKKSSARKTKKTPQKKKKMSPKRARKRATVASKLKSRGIKTKILEIGGLLNTMRPREDVGA